jgi:hypothetical protein
MYRFFVCGLVDFITLVVSKSFLQDAQKDKKDQGDNRKKRIIRAHRRETLQDCVAKVEDIDDLSELQQDGDRQEVENVEPGGRYLVAWVHVALML